MFGKSASFSPSSSDIPRAGEEEAGGVRQAVHVGLAGYFRLQVREAAAQNGSEDHQLWSHTADVQRECVPRSRNH